MINHLYITHYKMFMPPQLNLQNKKLQAKYYINISLQLSAQQNFLFDYPV